MEYFYNGIGSFKREDLQMGSLVIDIMDESIKFLVNHDFYIIQQNSHPNGSEMKNIKFNSINENKMVVTNGRVALKI